ncbi:DNA topoisomerase III [Angomonas deanei]|nr:DNA topoisomerase III [Angomonas deanei]|eukprot:EPY26941.1 DNA topoisomerase III [Angomonas deanei]
MEIFTYEKWNSSFIPNYQQGTTFTPTEVLLEKHRTAAPPSLTETNLISLMDRNGIGTDATIAQHIKTVLDREYVRREGQTLVPTTLGIALASAYEVLGLSSLLQPQLRAQMEMAMNDIANGAATKEQVLEAAVRLYKEIFEALAANAGKFEAELGQHLPRSRGVSSDTTVVKQNLCPCGKCGGSMNLIKRTETGGGRESSYVHCNQCAEQCRVPGGHNSDLELLQPQQKCALCPFFALRVTNREKRTSYTVCPYCFTHPPHGPDIEAVGEFRCFQCTADCPLASGLENVGIVSCVSCQGNELRLRNGPTGPYLSCKGWPECGVTVTLPTASSVKPCPGRRCPTCQAVLLTFDFRGVQGVPGMEQEETVCISCDPRLKDYIAVKGHVARPAAPVAPAYTLPTAKRPAAGDHSNGGVPMCACGQPAKSLVSRKEQSMGKKFFACKDRKCQFFKWADQ